MKMNKSIPERGSYISLMKARALGEAPEMGSAVRMAGIIKKLIGSNVTGRITLLDIGCAAGHYLRSIASQIPSANIHYTGIDIDPGMILAANEVWNHDKSKYMNIETQFIQSSIENLSNLGLQSVDVVFCANAFMYFPRPKKTIEDMLKLSKKHCVIRSYFCSQTFIIKRAQPSELHPHLDIGEKDILDEFGEPLRYDHWNIYSQKLIEHFVKSSGGEWGIEWEDDQNPTQSMQEETQVGIQKFDATKVWNNQEIVYPFILPWKYAVMTKVIADS